MYKRQAGTFYGKTGTGRVDGQDVNGWFVGLLETADNTSVSYTHLDVYKRQLLLSVETLA